MKSLIAEDDATNRKLLYAILSRHGECDIAVDGKEAVTSVRMARQAKQSYDLVCMDLRMPEMDGHEAIREIRKQEASAGVFKPVKIIVTTAHSDMESISGAIQGGCNAYLVKPVDTAKLRKQLETMGLIKATVVPVAESTPAPAAQPAAEPEPASETAPAAQA
jgi:two-component system chemotaxis response regulator CheY